MHRDMFAKESSSEDGFEYFKKAKTEISKNHQVDRCQDVDAGGIIPFQSDEYGWNPGKLLQSYLSCLPPLDGDTLPFLFLRPRRVCGKFNPNVLTRVWYDAKAKIGENMVANSIKRLCEWAGIPPYSNHSCRATGIRILKRVGLDDRDICSFSGHRSAQSLLSYDPVPDLALKRKVATALQVGHKKMKRNINNLVSCAYHVLFESVYHRLNNAMNLFPFRKVTKMLNLPRNLIQMRSRWRVLNLWIVVVFIRIR